jgi:hypothetical protein
MAIHGDELDGGWGRGKRRETLEYQAIYLIAYVAFLAAALIGRVLPWRWRILGGPGVGGKTVFEEARDLTTGTVPYAFMR